MTGWGRIGVAGGWLLGVLIGTGGALAGTARPAQVVTTQRVVVAPQAFAADDPVMANPHAAKALSATMVSATFTNTPAMQAFAQLAKQSGYAIEPYGGGGNNPTKYGNVTATINNQPFWAAVREVCTRGNVALYYYGDDDPERIQLMPSNYGQQHMMKAPASVHGPFLTVVTNLERSNTVQMNAPQQVDRKINIQIHTFTEPRARPTQYSYQPTIDEAVDDHGNSLVPPPGQERHSHMQSNRGLSWSGHFQLPYPTTNPGTRIARLRGHIDAKVQLQSEPWEINHPLKAAEATRTFGGRKVEFKSFKSAESTGQYRLELVYHRNADEDEQSFMAIHHTEPTIKLSDAKNTRYQSHGGGSHGDAKQITRTFTFYRQSGGGGSGDAPPNRLVIEVATAVQDVKIPFELVDLPLP